MIKHIFDGNYLIQKIVEKRPEMAISLPSKNNNPSGAMPAIIIQKPVSYDDGPKYDLLNVGDVVLVDVARVMDFPGGEMVNERFIMALMESDI